MRLLAAIGAVMTVVLGATVAAHFAGWVDLRWLLRTADHAVTDAAPGEDGAETTTIAGEDETAAPQLPSAPERAGEAETVASPDAATDGKATSQPGPSPVSPPDAQALDTRPSAATGAAGPIVPPVKRVTPKTPPLPGEETKPAGKKAPGKTDKRKQAPVTPN